VDPKEASEVVLNDPALTARLASSLRRSVGDARVVLTEPSSGSEDFGVFGHVAGVPSVQLRLGHRSPSVFAKAKADGKLPPGLHTSTFAPDRKPTIRTGVALFTLSLLELLPPPTSRP
jgi:metal-dependent amidase/aminoacylase/carboxypeptidase family protein